ncbi:MAG: CopG family transcriptional regulator [Asgard group archaeon]|nr:CopG family transcriptional regulator [Asgard group archaeon]
MYEETKMEKLTINLPPVELGRIDILVEAGYYNNRTEFIRAAIRKTLDSHQDYIDTQIKQYKDTYDEEEKADDKEHDTTYSMGVISIGKKHFERVLDKGKKAKIHVVGLLNIEKDVTPELILKSVESIRVNGVLRASPEVKAALNKIKNERKKD